MPINVGFIGAGGIANVHMNELLSIDDVQIAAVCDVNKDRAESAATRYIAKPYADYREMLAEEELDALYICLPPFAHEGQEIESARRGINIFVEKPVGIDISLAREVRGEVEKSGIISAVGYHWRYQSGVDRAKEILADRKIAMALGYWLGGFPDIHWWRRMEMSGGQVVEQATHIFDLARYMCGEIREVYAAYGTRALKDVPDLNIPDVGTATLKFADGTIGAISTTCILETQHAIGLDIFTRDLTVEIHGGLRIIQPGHTEAFTSVNNSMQDETRAFIEAIKTGDRSLIRSDYSDAVKTLAVTLACNQSAQSGQPVAVDLE